MKEQIHQIIIKHTRHNDSAWSRICATEEIMELINKEVEKRIADKMVSERLREELIKYDDYRRGGEKNYPYSSRLVDEYLKNREK